MEWSRREMLGSVVGSIGAVCRRVAVRRPAGKPARKISVRPTNRLATA